MAKADRIPDAWPALMSDEMAAAFLDMSVGQFRVLVVAGHLPVGRKIANTSMVRWRREQLEAWINLEFGLPAKNSVAVLGAEDGNEWMVASNAN